MKKLLFVLIVVALFACRKEDDPYQPVIGCFIGTTYLTHDGVTAALDSFRIQNPTLDFMRRSAIPIYSVTRDSSAVTYFRQVPCPFTIPWQ